MPEKAALAGGERYRLLYCAPSNKITERGVAAMTDSDRKAIARMKCRDIMTKNVRTATSKSPLKEIAALMRDGDMGAVPIVDDGKLIGIVTDRDIVVRAVAEGLDPSDQVGRAMTRELFIAGPDDFVFEAVRLMGEKQIRRIPVVGSSGELSGIISMADIALETEDDLEIAETLEEISTGTGFWGRH